MNAESKRFEVVVCSRDRDRKSFGETFPLEEPWLAIPFEAAPDAVTSKYQPPGVPTLTIVDLDGNVVELEGDMHIDGGVGTFEQWLSAAGRA